MTEQIEPYGEPVGGVHDSWAEALAEYHLHACPDPATCTHAFEFYCAAGLGEGRPCPVAVRVRGMDLDQASEFCRAHERPTVTPLDRGDT